MFKNEKATWIWDGASVKNPQGILSFFEKQHVSNVYIQIDPSVSDTVYESFINQAHILGIQVHALDGAPDYTEQQLDLLLKRIDLLPFDGIHLDIEPYLSDEWKRSQKQAVHRYEKLIKKAADSGWILGADIPFWYDEIPSTTGQTLAEFVIKHADYTVIMAYRDSADRIIDVSANELALARSLNKTVWVAVETIENAEADGISFFGKSAAYFEKEIKKVEKKCGCRVAVHHAESWKTLLDQ